MTADILDGKTLAASLKSSIAKEVCSFKDKNQRPPGLAVILVGDDPASETYVNNKRNACIELGFESYAFNLLKEDREEKILKLIQDLNQNPKVDGILVQLPLPKHVATHAIIESILPSKDVDGFHPYNLGRLAQGHPKLRPCTPYGIIQLMQHYKRPLSGQHAVVIGASNIVGRPMALELLLAGATVSICHSLTKDLEKHVRAADILVVAAGVPDLVSVDWLNNKQTIIDVGIHRLENGKLRGDIAFELAKEKVAYITPVPGGVGPMTIVALLQNTLIAAQSAGQEDFEF